MRRAWVAALALAVALAGCRRRGSADEGLATTIYMGNPRQEKQLLTGFYAIEDNAWRWTAKNFAVVLRTPPAAGKNGAVLQIKLTVPPPSTEKLGPITLAAAVNGSALPPETFSKPGDYVYRGEVPPQAVSAASAEVDCQLDKTVPPGPVDQRELGIVVLSIGLSAK